jgi:pSer/pThr/pTyr-binding forkhead associated (FHA) protein
MNVQLLVNKGATRGKRIQLRHETTIVGRRRDCNLCIPSSEVSRRHCLLQFQDGYLTIEDLNSINGTFLNEERIADKNVVYPGDRLAIGPVHFTVQYELSPSARERLQLGQEARPEEPLEAVPVEEEPPTIKVDPDGPIPVDDQDFEVVQQVSDSQVVEIIDDPEIVELIEDAEIVEEVEDAEVVDIIEDAEVVEEIKEAPSPKKKQGAWQ